MKSICVTSMNETIFQSYGKYMIESWTRYWFPNSLLIVYAEDFMLEDSKHVRYLSWNKLCENDYKQFSLLTDYERARRFSKKGFSFLHAMENYKNQTNNLIWLDADILCKQPIQEELVLNLLPQNKLIALFDFFYKRNPNYSEKEYLDIKNRKAMSAESGFVMLNTCHKNYDIYIKNYRSLYTQEKHPVLTNWYDGEVVLISARNFLNDVEDLSKLRTTNKTQTPINKSFLNKYFTHQKGGVKKKLTSYDFENITQVKNEK